MPNWEEQLDRVYEEFLARYENQFIISDEELVLVGGQCGEPESTLAEAILAAPRADIPLADDMIQKILSVLSPQSVTGEAARHWLKATRPNFVEQTNAA